MNFMTFHILGTIILTDFHIFQRGIGIPPTSRMMNERLDWFVEMGKPRYFQNKACLAHCSGKKNVICYDMWMDQQLLYNAGAYKTPTFTSLGSLILYHSLCGDEHPLMAPCFLRR